jgi:transposase
MGNQLARVYTTSRGNALSKQRRSYTREFKLKAVRLSENPDKSVADLARELGIGPKLLYRWRREYRCKAEDAFPGHGRLSDSKAEIARLKREIAQTKEEIEILRKAIAWEKKQ